MHQTSSEQSRIVAAVVAAAARLPKSRRRADHKRFLRSVLRQRRRRGHGGARSAGARRRGACASRVRAPAPRPRPGPRVQSDRARARLHLAAHRHRGGERRHAVPRRLDRTRARAAVRSPCISWRIRFSPWRATAPASCAASRSAPRPRETAPRLESFQHVEIDRMVDPAALHSLCVGNRAQHARRARGVRRLGQDARGGARERPMISAP